MIVTGGNPMPFSPPQIPHGLSWDQSHALTVREQQLAVNDLDYNNFVFDCNALAGSAVLSEASLCCVHSGMWQLCCHIYIYHMLFSVDNCCYDSEFLTLRYLHHCNPHTAFAINYACVSVRTQCESLHQRLLLKEHYAVNQIQSQQSLHPIH